MRKNFCGKVTLTIFKSPCQYLNDKINTPGCIKSPWHPGPWLLSLHIGPTTIKSTNVYRMQLTIFLYYNNNDDIAISKTLRLVIIIVLYNLVTAQVCDKFAIVRNGHTVCWYLTVGRTKTMNVDCEGYAGERIWKKLQPLYNISWKLRIINTWLCCWCF